MYITSTTLRDAEERYGTARVESYAAQFTEREFDLLRRALARRRAHDVTMFIRDGTRFALIRKHDYPPGVFRPPSGGVMPDERLDRGAEREAYEETGLRIRLENYIFRFECRFSFAEEIIDWTTYVFTAKALTHRLRIHDRVEVAEACWATADEMQRVIRPRMLNWNTPGMRYRVWLQDLALERLGVGSSLG